MSMARLDPHRRPIDYLRISITDRCNERCVYCMPEGLVDWKERDEVLTYEEILRVVRVATRLGFRKFRVTGGEPLLRRNVVDFLADLKRITGVDSLGISTNGTFLPKLGEGLRAAGVQSLNISLDALTPTTYRKITKAEVQPVIEGIRIAVRLGFPSIKLNAVLMRGMNEDEIWPLVRFAAEQQLILRFIELMPITTTEMLTEANFLPIGEVIRRLGEKDRLIPLENIQFGHGPARYYKLEKTGATLGFIGMMTNLHFCESCNKIRLTADGKLRPCLGNHDEVDLRATLRNGAGDDEIAAIFEQTLVIKPLEHTMRDQYQPSRCMHAIGG